MSISLFAILNDAFFAAIAAVGFASISNPKRRTYLPLAILAAAGHVMRFVLLESGVHLTLASFVAGVVIGTLALPLAMRYRCPADSLCFPALLPMVPGKFAYGSIQSLVACLAHSKNEEVFQHYSYLFQYNWLTCILTIVMMVSGAIIPLYTARNHGLKLLRKHDI